MSNASVYEPLGFAWDRAVAPTDVPTPSVERAVFRMHKSPTSDHLHDIVAHDEALGAGRFRGEGAERRLTPTVALGLDERHIPPATEAGSAHLRQLHARGLAALTTALDWPYEQGLAYFLLGHGTSFISTETGGLRVS